ncbi:MAG TPA: DUF1800 domain-containing protein, partial [Gemmatimonadales bacterium]
MTRGYPLLVCALAASTLPASAQQALSPLDSAVHALNRLTWGTRPGMADSIARSGVMLWLETQLAVTRPGDPALAERERAFPVLRASSEDLVRELTEMRQARATRRAQSGDSGARMGPDPRTRNPDASDRRAFRLLGPQLQQATLVRAVEAEDQLAEVMADFWFNHFNVYQNKGLDRALLPAYVEKTIRPRSLGRFEDLLIATAKSPAMLFYLDNVQSVAPGATPPQLERLERLRGRAARVRPGGPQRMDSLRQAIERRRPTGLNENYARELLELHTLGVDGGYTQQDVTEVARVFTGWGVGAPRDGGTARFQYHEWAHDRGGKTVLGSAFPPGGEEEEGVRLLRLLAGHPSTIHFVSGKLCARLVSDVPPDGCVDAAVAAWRRSDGNIREILRAIVRSPEFWSSGAMGTKVKTPVEFVVSAMRAVGGVPDSTPRLAMQLVGLGQPLYLQSAPMGYPETQEDWVNSGALLARMNFAMALASGRLPGVTLDLDGLISADLDRESLIETVDRVILNGRMRPSTRAVIAKELADITDPMQARALVVGLAIGGPEF